MKKSNLLYLMALLVPWAVSAEVIVDDRWEDLDSAKTGELDADWWSSSSAGGNSLEIATENEAGDMGLVSGPSGRGVHATFAPQTLAVGDELIMTSTFTTPATVGVDRNASLRIALMDFNNEGLAASLTANSANPQELYLDLPGYMVEFDVNVTDLPEVIGVREHAVNETGRFLGTNQEWDLLGVSEEGDDYEILPNTEYVVVMSLKRTGADSMDVFASLSEGGTLLDSFTQSDATGIANNIGMLGFWSISRTFGSSSGADPDNGLTFSNVRIELNPQPQPGPSISVFPRIRLGELDASTLTISDTITVRNTGTDNALAISDVSFTGADNAFFTVDEAPTTIPPNGSADIKFTFAPNGTTGSFSAALEIQNDDVDPANRTVSIDVTASIVNPLGPLAHYKLDEADGTVMNDVTGFGRNGEYDDVTLGQVGLATGTSASFDGGSTATVEGEVLGEPTSNFSISAWFNGDDFAGLRTLFGQGPAGNPGYALIASGTELQWFVSDSAEFTGGSITPGTTYHAVVTYGPDKATIYVDGVDVGSIDSPSELDVTVEDTFYIGSFAKALPFSGRIDDVQFYDRTLTAEDVTALFSTPGSVLAGSMEPEPEPEPSSPGIVVNDNWEDSDRAKTGELDADWWSSNSGSGNSIEVEDGNIGLVSGTSGRGIHGTFAPQTLGVGSTLVATATFTTPATIGIDKSGAFKMALMEFNDEGLAADLLSSSTSPNPIYTNLPGYLVDFDVNKSDATENIAIREHIPNETGRFLGTSAEWTSVGNSEEDADYAFLPNTEYVTVFSLTRTGEDSMEISSSLSQGGVLLDSHTATDDAVIANNIGMLAYWVNSNTFGSTTEADPDNGLTFSNVTVELKASAEPSGGGDWVAALSFEGLDLGPIDGVGGWVSSDAGTTIVSTDGSNVLESAGAGQNAYASLGGTIPTGSTGTVFFRARAGDSADFVLGLSDVAEPSAWDDYEGYMRFAGTNIDVRDGGGFAPAVENFSVDTWYNIWLVLDNDALETTLYYSIGDEAAQLGATGAFRMSDGNTEHGDLINFLVRTGTANVSGQLGAVYLASGENLTIPAAPGWAVSSDLEGLDAGTVNGQGGWVSSTPDGTLVVADGGNQALDVVGGGLNAYVPLSSPIPSGASGTVYFRARAGEAPDFVLGVSDVAEPGAWDDYEGYMRFAGTNIDIRDGGGFAPALENFSVDTWYNIWLVLDNDALAATLYYSTGDEAAQLGATGAFRMSDGNTEHGDLINFLVRSGNAHTAGQVDNIYVDVAGENLTIPQAVLDGLGTGEGTPEITGVSRSATGVSLSLPDGTTYDIEYSLDLIAWETIASDVSGSYEDTDAARLESANGFYRGVVK